MIAFVNTFVIPLSASAFSVGRGGQAMQRPSRAGEGTLLETLDRVAYELGQLDLQERQECRR